jgi:hypothetical protein
LFIQIPFDTNIQCVNITEALILTRSRLSCWRPLGGGGRGGEGNPWKEEVQRGEFGWCEEAIIEDTACAA